MSDETVRLFVSIDLNDSLRKAMRPLDWWIDHLDGFRKVRAKNRHVTVAFIGDVPAPCVDAIAHALGPVIDRHRAFRMEPIGLIPMPSVHRQRVIAIGLDGTTGFDRLAVDVHGALLGTAAGERFLGDPDRPQRAHITVARKKRSGGSKRADLSEAPRFECVVPCHSVELVRSELTGEGPIYTPLARWPLAGGAEC